MKKFNRYWGPTLPGVVNKHVYPTWGCFRTRYNFPGKWFWRRFFKTHIFNNYDYLHLKEGQASTGKEKSTFYRHGGLVECGHLIYIYTTIYSYQNENKIADW